MLFDGSLAPKVGQTTVHDRIYSDFPAKNTVQKPIYRRFTITS